MKRIINFFKKLFDTSDLCPNCGYYCTCNSVYCLPPEEKKEETFYHPVTGYKGTKSEMDAYIINRERKSNISLSD